MLKVSPSVSARQRRLACGVYPTSNAYLSYTPGGYLYVSTDGGSTWLALLAAKVHDWRDITLSANGLTGAAVASDGCIYLYDIPAPVQPSTKTPAPGVCLKGLGTYASIASSGSGATIVAADQGGFIATSYDSGFTWVSHPDAGSYSWSGVAISKDGSTIIAVALDGTVSVSTTAGQSWQLQPDAPKQNWTSVAFTSDGRTAVAAVSSGNLYASTDGGSHWSPLATPAGAWTSVDASSSGTIQIASVKVRHQAVRHCVDEQGR